MPKTPNERIATLKAELVETQDAAAAMVVLCTDRRKRHGL